MKRLLFNLLVLTLLSLGLLSFFRGTKRTVAYSTTGCGPSNMNQIHQRTDGKWMVPLPGWGSHHMAISTRSDSAQYYFDQGLTLYYSYHPKESLASFREASRFDSTALMPYFGQLLAMGPTYNGAHLYMLPADVNETIRKAQNAISAGNEFEQALTRATMARYLVTTIATTREQLNRYYSDELRKLLKRYPDNDDLCMLYVDAVMLEHPWDFWNSDGSPKPWTNELVQITQKTLSRSPLHPAALHYHIHLTEASRQPEVGIADADRLKVLLPGVAHMVHMSSHEYERNGLFAKGIDVNDKADAALLHYDSLAPNLSLTKHSLHYFAVQTYCALSGAMVAETKRTAERCRAFAPLIPADTYNQYLYMFPVLAELRLGQWQPVLEGSPVDAQFPYANILYHFARGMALVNTGRSSDAAGELEQLQKRLDDPVLRTRRIPFNTAQEGAMIANYILSGSIAAARGDMKTAIDDFNKSSAVEDSLIYTEPRDWLLPARQYLGAYLLQQGRAAEAEKVYREDLVWNPGNGWSLLGLYQSLQKQGKRNELEKYREAYELSFAKATAIPPASAFIK